MQSIKLQLIKRQNDRWGGDRKGNDYGYSRQVWVSEQENGMVALKNVADINRVDTKTKGDKTLVWCYRTDRYAGIMQHE